MDSFIDFQQVTRNYGSCLGISDFSFRINKGERVGLFGLNGSGKTTTLKIMCGLLHPTSGTVTVAAQPPVRSRYLFSFLNDKSTFLPWMSIRDVDRLLTGLFPRYQPSLFYQFIQLLDVPSQRVGQMSKGQLQRLKLCASTAVKTDIYLFDEPLAGIDVISRQKIMTAINANIHIDSICIISTHEIKEVAAVLSRVLILAQGKLIRDITYDPQKQGSEFLVTEFVRAVDKSGEQNAGC